MSKTLQSLMALLLLCFLGLPGALAQEDCNDNGIPDDVDSQVTFQTHEVATGVYSAKALSAPDLDGDGDRDLLYADYSSIAWRRNLDSLGGFGAEEIVLNGVTGVTVARAADLDGDHDLDVISASTGQLRWLENLDGGGTFGTIHVVPQDPLDPRAVAVGDIDGDLDPDLVVAYSDDDRIAWFENLNGIGNYGPPRLLSDAPDGPWQLLCLDFDGDGDQDILAAIRFDAEVVWYENLDGEGTFAPAVLLVSGMTGVNDIALADIDSTGGLDLLIVAEVADMIVWLPTTGTGGVGALGLVSQTVNGPRTAVGADLDGDGDNDVVSASFFDDTVAWYENVDGAGTFGPQQPVIDDANGATVVVAADLDGDADLDLASAAGADGKIRWHDNRSLDCDDNGIPDGCDLEQGAEDCDGDGILDVCQIATGGPDCNDNYVLDSCDIDSGESLDDCENGVPDECEPDCNGNGNPDSCDISSGSSQDQCSNGVPDECEPDCNDNDVPDRCDLLMGTSLDSCGVGIPDECQLDCNGNTIPDICDTAPDCNANGVPDSCDVDDGTSDDCNHNAVPDECDSPDCNGNSSPDSCDIDSGISPDCDGSDVPDECELEPAFAPDSPLPTYSEVVGVLAADMDGDADLDLLAAQIAPRWIQLFENLDGQGTFGPGLEVNSGSDKMDVADLDGDGDLDLVAGGHNNDTDQLSTRWVEQVHPTGFVDRPISDLDPIYLDAADLDGDSDMDIVFAHEDSGLVGWFENEDGAGGFSEDHRQILDLDGSQTAVAADLDADGDLDVIVASWNDVLVWSENTDGAATFGPPRTIAACSGEELVAEDLDGDGDLDLLTVCEGMRWFENLDGRGSFGPGEQIEDYWAVRTVAAADLDGDGDLDAFCDGADNSLSWFENLDGQGSFGPARAIAAYHGATQSVIAADFDGDGDVDVVGSLYWDGAITSYRNVGRDCDHNGLLDECELSAGTTEDCDGDLAPDICQLATGAARDCNSNDVPDTCDVSCFPPCDADFDACLDPLDCDPANSGVWADPQPARMLQLARLGSTTELSWFIPLEPGGLAVRYDTLASTDRSDFVTPASCVETDGADTRSEDSTLPDPGEALFYLIRVENDCPGGVGAMGSGSDGVPRVGLSCP